ncbi:MAG: hypothetical protein AVDCRST_MAG66-3680 [uncultured Pseudonocardia sp.]|uniref:DUF3040 domain-containing protein n=1 Tax=uncultured Pseudonocardia sp. TaxID=211455 RepID=A0A6J4QGB9_9PSEU|nr:MAG: hypothetical protein AVDCRST_MAG66-3680 [uncultured Pseudonocardia sp.]
MPLSPRERAELAAIEADLRDEDPALAHALSAAPPRWLPVPVSAIALLAVALLALVAVHTVVPGLPPAVSAVLAVVVSASWVVHTARHAGAPRPAAVLDPARGGTTA